MLSVRISSYGCTREVWRARKMRELLEAQPRATLQYSSQIVETGAICLEFSPNFLHSLLTPSFSLTLAPLLPQCWARRILKQ